MAEADGISGAKAPLCDDAPQVLGGTAPASNVLLAVPGDDTSPGDILCAVPGDDAPQAMLHLQFRAVLHPQASWCLQAMIGRQVGLGLLVQAVIDLQIVTSPD